MLYILSVIPHNDRTLFVTFNVCTPKHINFLHDQRRATFVGGNSAIIALFFSTKNPPFLTK